MFGESLVGTREDCGPNTSPTIQSTESWDDLVELLLVAVSIAVEMDDEFLRVETELS